MLHALDFIKNWRCFKTGDRFEFRPGVNLLVGDQGCGKSSLLRAIHVGGTKGKNFGGSDKELRDGVLLEANPIKMFKFDFEKDNPRTKGNLDDHIQFQVASMFSSHGECTRTFIHALEEAADCLCLMDEPDMALSIRSCNMLALTLKALEERSSQVVAAVHSLALIQQFEEVYSLEHRRWMTNAEFIETQNDPTEFVPYKKPKAKEKKRVVPMRSPSHGIEKTSAQVIQEL